MALASLMRVAKQTLKKATFGATALIIGSSGLLFAAPLFLSQPVEAATLNVCSSGCTYTDIQSAINAASSNDTISVGAGTYTAGFTVSGKTNLTIAGSGTGSTIITPASLISTGVQHKYTSNMQVSVFVNNSTGITVSGMTIKDNGSTPGAGGPDALVFWNGSTGTLSNDAITAGYTINGDQTGQGIALDGSSGTVSLNVTNTNISGFQKNGIDVIDGNGATSGATDTTTLTVTGGSITGAGNTGTIAQNGIVLWNRGGGTVTGTVDGTSFSNFGYSSSSDYATGVLAYGGGNLTSIKNSSFTGFTGSSQYAYYLATVSGSGNIDATSGNTFGGVSPASATFSQLGMIQDSLLDKVSDSTDSSAVIRILANTIIVSPNNSQGIQGAINAATAGDTVDVAPGTYTSDTTVSKSLTLQGNQASVAAASTSTGIQRSGSESTVSRFYITSSNVTVNGFSFNGTSTSGQLQVLSGSTLSGITIENNIFSGYSNVALPTNGAGNISVKNNYFTNPSASAEAIQIKTLGNSGDCDESNVSYNVFKQASDNGAADINFSCTGSNSSNITISHNLDSGNTGDTSFTALAGISDGINIDSNVVSGMSGSAIFFWGGVTGAATISGNSITGGSSNAVSIQDMGASYGTNSGTFTIENNDLSGNSFGVKVGSGALSGSGSANAASNYWGSNVDPSTLVSSGVSYKPYYLDSNRSILSTGDSLASLSLSSGTLSPTFSSSTTSYTASVVNSVSSVTISDSASTGATVTVNGSSSPTVSLAVGSNTVSVKVTSADGTASQTYTVTITRAAATQTVPDSSGNATVTSSTPTLVVTSASTPLTVTVSSGTTNATIDYSALKTSSTTAVIPQTTINTQNANVQLQSGTTITASSSSWNGVITAPTVQTATSVSIPAPAGQSTIVGTVIEVGAGDINLTFDKAARLLIPGQAGKLIGFERSGTFTQITTLCSADSQAAGNALPAGGDCYINVGSDMAVWTKHFTTFVTYTPSNTYVVQSGDTMFTIALKFGLSLAQLESLNPGAGHPAGNFSFILPGDVLKVGSAVLLSSASSTGTSGSVLGANTGNGQIGSALSTTNNGQVKGAETPAKAAASAANATAASKWYWWVIAVIVIVAAGSVWYIYRLADNDKKA